MEFEESMDYSPRTLLPLKFMQIWIFMPLCLMRYSAYKISIHQINIQGYSAHDQF